MSVINNEHGNCSYCICEDCAMVFDLYIKKENRRQGHGKQLLQEAINEIRKFGYLEFIKVKVEPTEDSVSVENLTFFYKELGLEIDS